MHTNTLLCAIILLRELRLLAIVRKQKQPLPLSDLVSFLPVNTYEYIHFAMELFGIKKLNTKLGARCDCYVNFVFVMFTHGKYRNIYIIKKQAVQQQRHKRSTVTALVVASILTLGMKYFTLSLYSFGCEAKRTVEFRYSTSKTSRLQRNWGTRVS